MEIQTLVDQKPLLVFQTITPKNIALMIYMLLLCHRKNIIFA